MKLLVLTERFYPEEFLINDLCSEWIKKGWRIEVLTQTPSYPKDRIFDLYRNRLYQTTYEFNKIPVHRIRTVLGYNKSVFWKITNYINFAFFTSIWALFCGYRYDKVFTYHTGPLSMASAGLIFHFVWRRKCVIWTQDVWPDTVYSYGIKKTYLMDLFLKMVVIAIYAAYQKIMVSSPCFIKIIKQYTNKDKEILFVPQWNAD